MPLALLNIEACLTGIRRVAPHGAIVSLSYEMIEYPHGREEWYTIRVGWPGNHKGASIIADNFPDAVRKTIDLLLHRKSITDRILQKVRRHLAEECES